MKKMLLIFLILGLLLIKITKATNFSSNLIACYDATNLTFTTNNNTNDTNLRFNGTNVNTISTLEGLNFTSAESYVNFSGAQAFDNDTEGLIGYSIIFKLRIWNFSSSNFELISKTQRTAGSTNTVGSWLMSTTATDKIDWFIGSTCGDLGSNNIESGQVLTNGSNLTFAFVFNGSATNNIDKARIYLNGTNTTSVSGGTIPNRLSDCVGNVTIGQSGYYKGLGAIYSFVVFLNRTISNSEVNEFRTGGNKNCAELLVGGSDVTPPSINVSFNATSPIGTNTIINFSANISDDTNNLLSANWTYNQSGIITKINYSLNSKSAQVSNTTKITVYSGNVINFTVFATDINNNIFQVSTLFNITDNIFPVVNTSFNITSPLLNDIINFTGNITDETGLLFANITYNISGIITKINFSISGTRIEISNATQITAEGVINFTMYATDTNNNVKQNSTIIITTAAGGGGSSGTTGGGGGGGSAFIVNEQPIIILGNLSLILKPPIIHSNFIYTPFKTKFGRFSIILTANKIIDRCISSIFECKIINNNTINIALNYTNDTIFISKISAPITLLDKSSLAKTIDAEVRFINLAYAIPLNISTRSKNYRIYRLDDIIDVQDKKQVIGIRIWFLLAIALTIGTGIYLYFKK